MRNARRTRKSRVTVPRPEDVQALQRMHQHQTGVDEERHDAPVPDVLRELRQREVVVEPELEGRVRGDRRARRPRPASGACRGSAGRRRGPCREQPHPHRASTSTPPNRATSAKSGTTREMHWRLKGAIQKVLGVRPAGRAAPLRPPAPRRRPDELRPRAAAEGRRLGADGRPPRAPSGIDVVGTRFFEMGTGWFPTLPLCLYLGGAESVDTVDLNPHMKPDLTLRVRERRSRRSLAGDREGDRSRRERARRDAARDRSRARARRVDRRARPTASIRYRAPADAAATDQPDVEPRRRVLEQRARARPRPGDRARASPSRRASCAPAASMFHSVNCGDHYAYVDRKLTQLHYLAYSDAAWKKWNNAFLYQNRLRATDFTTMARAAGLHDRGRHVAPPPQAHRRARADRRPPAVLAVHPRRARDHEHRLHRPQATRFLLALSAHRSEGRARRGSKDGRRHASKGRHLGPRARARSQTRAERQGLTEHSHREHPAHVSESGLLQGHEAIRRRESRGGDRGGIAPSRTCSPRRCAGWRTARRVLACSSSAAPR